MTDHGNSRRAILTAAENAVTGQRHQDSAPRRTAFARSPPYGASTQATATRPPTWRC